MKNSSERKRQEQDHELRKEADKIEVLKYLVMNKVEEMPLSYHTQHTHHTHTYPFRIWIFQNARFSIFFLIEKIPSS